MANAALEIYSDDVLVVGGTRRIHADNIILYVKNGVDALIAENEALREKLRTEIKLSVDNYVSATARATEAERKLAEARGLLASLIAIFRGNPRLSSLRGWWSRSRAQIDALLSKEAERG